jgi:hypothetical protein
LRTRKSPKKSDFNEQSAAIDLQPKTFDIDIKDSVYPGVTAEVDIDTAVGFGSISYVGTDVCTTFKLSDPEDRTEFSAEVETLLRSSPIPSQEVDSFCEFFTLFLTKSTSARFWVGALYFVVFNYCCEFGTFFSFCFAMWFLSGLI